MRKRGFPTVPDKPWEYGNFCGYSKVARCQQVPGISGWFPIPPPGNPKPIDLLDKACMAHDCCLKGKKDAASPDGTFLVYATPCTGHGDIYLIESGKTEPKRLTSGEEYEASPLLASDGKRIVFVRERGGNRHLWMMNRDGSGAVQLTSGKVLDDVMSLSCDGRWVLFQRSIEVGLGGLEADAFLLRIGVPDHKLVRVSGYAIFSSDGKSVIYSESAAEELWVMDLNEKRSRRRLQHRGMPIDVSDDGNRILTTRITAKTAFEVDHELWVFDWKSGSEVQLRDGHSAVFFGPECDHVLFYVSFEKSPYVSTVDGRTESRITCRFAPTTYPKSVLNGQGVLFASFGGTGKPEFDVVFISHNAQQPAVIASIQPMLTKFPRKIGVSTAEKGGD